MMVSAADNRLEWIDWMKALGIYLIVLGHFYSTGEKFIYVFHVPLFFLISGFLCKREDSQRAFWRKLWYNLAVPMLIMATMNYIFHCILQLCYGTFRFSDIYWFVRNILFGMVSGFDTLWFVYTLMALKIIIQLCKSNPMFYSLSAVMLVLAYVYNNIDLSGLPFFLKEPNAIVDVCTAFPFFAFGVFLHDRRALLNGWNHRIQLLIIATGGILGVSICYFYNGSAGLYRCDYGSNIFLFLFGGFMGSMMIFAISKFMGHVSKAVSIISQGTIVILGFHKLFIDLIWVFFPASYLDILFAALIVMLFVPVIVATEKFFPLIVGKYRIRKP